MNNARISEVNKITEEAANIGLDAQGWGPSTKEDLGGEEGGWMGELGAAKPKYDAMISLGLGDKTLAIIESDIAFPYRNRTHKIDHYIVGVGEALRPYISLYSGSNASLAVTSFRNEARSWINDIEEGIIAEGGDVSYFHSNEDI